MLDFLQYFDEDEMNPEDREFAMQIKKKEYTEELKKMQEDSDDELIITEEKLEEIVNKMVTMEFATDEDCIKYFDECYQKA